MKRTVNKVETKDPGLKDTDVILWKNTGGGSFRLGRRIIKPGEKFEATEKEISLGFRDVLKQVGGATPSPLVEKAKAVIPGVKSVFKLKPRKGAKNLYDVVSDATIVKGGEKVIVEKPLNTVGLTKEKAEKLIAALAG